MVTYERTVTTEAAVATTISRAPAVHVAVEEKIHCPSLHLQLSKIRLQLKDNVHTLLYISIKEKMRWSKYASHNNSVNMKCAVYFLWGTEHSDSLLLQQRQTSHRDHSLWGQLCSSQRATSVGRNTSQVRSRGLIPLKGKIKSHDAFETQKYISSYNYLRENIT